MFGWLELPAKSGEEENSIENETKDSSNGALAFKGGVAESSVASLASTATYNKEAADKIFRRFFAIVLIPQNVQIADDDSNEENLNVLRMPCKSPSRHPVSCLQGVQNGCHSNTHDTNRSRCVAVMDVQN